MNSVPVNCIKYDVLVIVHHLRLLKLQRASHCISLLRHVESRAVVSTMFLRSEGANL